MVIVIGIFAYLIVQIFIAYIVALKGESVHGIVYAAASVGSAGIVVLYFFSFKGNFGGKWAALTALSLGTIVPLLGDLVFDFIPYPYFTGFVMALIGYLIVGLIERLKMLSKRS